MLPFESSPQPFYCYSYFHTGSHHFFQAILGHDLPIYTSNVVGVTEMHHHAQLSLVEMGSHQFFAWAGL